MTVVCLFLAASCVAGPARWDFEDGTLQGWKVVSGDLGPQPTDASDDRWGDAFGKQGNYFIGTGELPGGRFSDALTGELRSPEFIITQNKLRLLVGGGNHPAECFVALVDALTGKELVRATGRNAEWMQPVVWNVSQWKGRRVYLRVVDKHKGGWGHINIDDIRELTPDEVRSLEREQARRRAEAERMLALWQRRLWERRRRVYFGERLARLAVPLGGIGTGSIYVCGNGDLRGWQIFNHVNLSAELPHAFFAVWARPDATGPRTSRVLQTGGVGTWPGVQRAECIPEYPLVLLGFDDPALPVLVGAECFSPMQPLDARRSAIPAVIFVFRLVNVTSSWVSASILASLPNAVGWDGYSEIDEVRNERLGGNVNLLHRVGPHARAIIMKNARLPASDPAYGTMALAVLDDGRGAVSCHPGWTDLAALREDFEDDGRLAGPPRAGPTAPGQTVNGALAVSVSLPPGGRREVAFAICWHFPNRLREWHGGPKDARVGNMYNNWYTDAEGVARDIAANYRELRRNTELFHQALYSSTLPSWLLECIGVHIASVRSPLVMWLEDGTVAGFEGLRDRVGCCPMNCTHVYNYAQTMAFVWPELERRVRELDLSVQMMDDGGIRHRLQLPLNLPRTTGPATDGHLSTILKAYREVRNTPDLDWLRQWWPRIERAMDFVLDKWDADGNGVIEGPQPNTYDCTCYGANTFIGTLYLAALRAAEEMAERVGDSAAATRYRERFQRGRTNLDSVCWREDLGYYVQVYDAAKYRTKQWGIGCLADQLLGQWWAHVLDLGELLPAKHVREALRSVYRHNFRTGYVLAPYHHAPGGRDMGLLNCTWPFGGRPAEPINYADGAWTGVEYQVAATMVWEGLVNTGLTIAKAARERYDGKHRNPFDEPECGHHYARPMSSWSLLMALSGAYVDGPRRELRLVRLPPSGLQCLLIAPEGWGRLVVESQKGSADIRVECWKGMMRWSHIVARMPRRAGRSVTVRVEKLPQAAVLRARGRWEGEDLHIIVEPAAFVREGEALWIAVAGVD